mgnify:FL=1
MIHTIKGMFPPFLVCLCCIEERLLLFVTFFRSSYFEGFFDVDTRMCRFGIGLENTFLVGFRCLLEFQKSFLIPTSTNAISTMMKKIKRSTHSERLSFLSELESSLPPGKETLAQPAATTS